MVNVMAVLLVLFGLAFVLKTDWILEVRRREKAAGTNDEPEDVDMPEWASGLTQAFGLFFLLFGLGFILQPL